MADLSYILYIVVIYPLLYILPAYVANGAPVIFGGGTPLDFGRKLGGKPIFGNHKTIRGLISDWRPDLSWRQRKRSCFMIISS